jgi:hypothetical protein
MRVMFKCCQSVSRQVRRWRRPFIGHNGWKNEGIEVIDPLNEMISVRYDVAG